MARISQIFHRYQQTLPQGTYAPALKSISEPVDYVLSNMVAGPVGALVLPSGTGKSMLVLQLAIQIADWPDPLEIGQGTVTYLPTEDPLIIIRHRIHALGKGAKDCRPTVLIP